jgi:hypothetical protein
VAEANACTALGFNILVVSQLYLRWQVSHKAPLTAVGTWSVYSTEYRSCWLSWQCTTSVVIVGHLSGFLSSPVDSNAACAEDDHRYENRGIEFLSISEKYTYHSGIEIVNK